MKTVLKYLAISFLMVLGSTASNEACAQNAGNPTAVILDSPSNGTTYVAPVTVTMIAHPLISGSNTGGSGACSAFDCSYTKILWVALEVNGQEVCKSFSMLYMCDWYANVPGTYTVQAALTTITGSVLRSQAKVVTVVN